MLYNNKNSNLKHNTLHNVNHRDYLGKKSIGLTLWITYDIIHEIFTEFVACNPRTIILQLQFQS